MFNIKPNRRGLIQLLLISLGITTVINGILFTFNINQSVTQPIKPEYPLLPSSWMIGLIWTVLIGFMAYTQWLLIKKTALDKFRSSDGWDAGINGSIAITTLGTGKDFSIENIKEPIIAFAFSHKGLMGNITLEGTKITKIQK